MPLETRVIWSQPGLEICCRPYLIGKSLAKLAEKASEDWIRDLSSREQLGDNAVSLEILNGGHFYYVTKAYTTVTGKPCPVASLRAKRHCDPANNEWSVDIWQENLGSLADATCILIGDTIATGTTLSGVLEHVVDCMRQKNNFVDVHIFTIAGSYECEPFLEEAAALLEKEGGKKMTLTYSNCKFALADNGTDLKFGSARDMVPEAEKGIKEALPGGFEQRLKCSIFDWGDRFTKPLRHLDEVVEYFHSIGGVPKWMQDGMDLSRAEAEDLATPTEGRLSVNRKSSTVW